jgi:hypothetical protein
MGKNESGKYRKEKGRLLKIIDALNIKSETHTHKKDVL